MDRLITLSEAIADAKGKTPQQRAAFKAWETMRSEAWKDRRRMVAFLRSILAPLVAAEDRMRKGYERDLDGPLANIRDAIYRLQKRIDDLGRKKR